MAKIVQNGITYTTASILWYKDLSATLLAGSTTLTISDNVITTSSNIDIDTDNVRVKPTSVTISSGSVVLTFEAQTEDVNVKVRIT